MNLIKKCRNEAKSAMQGYDSSLVVNIDETRFAPFSNSMYSFQSTMADGSAHPRKEGNQKKSFTLLCGVQADNQSFPPIFLLQNPRGFKKHNFVEKRITEDIMKYKSNRFTIFVNKKTNWMTHKVWEEILKSINEKNIRKNQHLLVIADNCPVHSKPELSNVKLHFLIPKTTSQCQPCDMLYISQIKRTYKSWYNDKVDAFDIPDISKSIDAVVDIIEKLKPDIIEKSWSKSAMIGYGIDDVSAPDEFFTMFETQLNLNDDRSIEEDVLPNTIQEIQCEETNSEPIETKTRQLSILDFCKK